jgi:predicted double-glycine peptidase
MLVRLPRRISRILLLTALSSWACLSNEIPWLDVPFVRQVRAGCGSAALAMVMQYWVKHQPGLDAAAADAERIDKALPPSSEGISGEALKRYLEEHGFAAFVFNGELEDLRNHVAKGRPAVVCLAPKGPRAPLHFVVVVGVGEDAMLLNDPARGKLIRERQDSFLRAWKVTGNWALLAVPRPSP